VGCGTGEHVRHFAERGWNAVGIDLAESMIAQALDHAGETVAGGRARFVLQGAADAASLAEAPFGAAICLGNTLAFVESAHELRRFFEGVAGALAPGGILLLQMLNYERIEGVPVRALPVNVRPLPPEEGEGELVFVRILSPRGDGTVDFYPITMTLRPGHEPLVEVRHAREAVHHAWKRPQLEAALAEVGFGEIRALGAMADTPYRSLDSPDLVIAARRLGK
jgi:SAM-dependent methyltransferase